MLLTGGKLDIIWAAGYVIILMIGIWYLERKIEGTNEK